MAIEGPLRELGIHDVFQLLDLSRKTGVLRVTSELRDDEGMVYFDGGRVVRANIRSKTLPTELALVQAGKVAEAELEDARAKQRNGRAGADVIDLLLEAGAISPRELERQLRLQIESVVFELMSWREGFFSFEERGAGEIPRDSRIKVSTESLLMEGARRIDEWSRIADKVPSLGVVPELAPLANESGESQLDLLPHEWEMLTMIDGQRDLRAIAATLGRDEFEVAKVAYGLVSTGVIVLRQPDRTSAPMPAMSEDVAPVVQRGSQALKRGELDEALNAAREALAASAGSTEARILAAQALVRLGRHSAAVDELRRAVQADPLTPEVHLELGFAATRLGDFATARSSWEHYLRLAPAAPEVGRVRAAIETITRLTHLLEAHVDA